MDEQPKTENILDLFGPPPSSAAASSAAGGDSADVYATIDASKKKKRLSVADSPAITQSDDWDVFA